MEKETLNTWYPTIIKWQEIYHNEEYQSGSGKSDLHTYKTIEHEAVVLYCKETGEHKVIKHKEDLIITGKEA